MTGTRCCPPPDPPFLHAAPPGRPRRGITQRASFTPVHETRRNTRLPLPLLLMPGETPPSFVDVHSPSWRDHTPTRRRGRVFRLMCIHAYIRIYVYLWGRVERVVTNNDCITRIVITRAYFDDDTRRVRNNTIIFVIRWYIVIRWYRPRRWSLQNAFRLPLVQVFRLGLNTYYI